MSPRAGGRDRPAWRREAGALWACFALSARERWALRVDLIGSAFFLGLLLFIFGRLWQAVAAPDGSVGAWSVGQLLAYLLVTETIVMAPGMVHLRVGEDVRAGEIAVHLLRPVGYVAWELARALGAAAVRAAAVMAVGAVGLALVGVAPRPDARGVAWGLALVPAAVAVETCTRLLFGLLAFWCEDAAPFYWVWQKASFLLGGLLVPLDMYPAWLRDVASCLPFQAVLHDTARTVVRFDAGAAAGCALRLAAWGACAALLLCLLHGRARARVQVNGG